MKQKQALGEFEIVISDLVFNGQIKFKDIDILFAKAKEKVKSDIVNLYRLVK